jgi:hypothetical protein
MYPRRLAHCFPRLIALNEKSLFLFCLLGVTLVRASAVEELVNGFASFNTTAPTCANIPDWDTGWGASDVTGWNYIGSINGNASAVYLGNNWVITAAHVGAGTFYLNGDGYDEAPGSAKGIVTATGTADLTLFKLTEAPDLPPLAIEATTPVPLSQSQPGALVAMLGNGGGESWGLNTITAVNLTEQIGGFTFKTLDFETDLGTTTLGSESATNDATFVVGDSGGGDFIYDSVTGSWQLAGLNERLDSNNDANMIELSAYCSQIDALTGVPEPGGYLPAGLVLTVSIAFRNSFGRRKTER